MFLLRLINCKFHKILTTIMKMLFVFSNQRDARNQICANFQNKHTNNIHLSFYAVAHTALKSILFYWMVKRANAMIMASEEKKNMQLKQNFTLQWIRHLHGSSFHRIRQSLSVCVPNDFVLFAMHFFIFFTSFFHFLCTQTFLLCFHLILNSFAN